MLKIKKANTIFGIKPEWYIRIKDRYVPITEYKIKKGVGHLLVDELELEITDDNIYDYDYATTDDGTFGVEAEVTYRCTKCNNPTIVFEDKEQAKRHVERCLFNERVNSCVNCKNLKIIEYPPYPRFEKTYLSSETYHAFGGYKQPYCMKKEKNIDEFELYDFDNHVECHEYSEENVVTEQPEVFKKYMELIGSDDIYSEELSAEEKEIFLKGDFEID